jgi:hypothetical protein
MKLMKKTNPIERLESALADTSDVYVNGEVDAFQYFSELERSIRENVCEPFLVHAKASPPGFPSIALGETIAGWCVAKSNGYWLVYREKDDCFYCFWGADMQLLSAPGIYGSPLYCWSA